MALTPEQIAEIQRLKALMQPAANEAQRKAQAQWNAEQMAKQQGKAKGGLAHDKALKVFMKGTKAKERLYHGTGNLEGLTSFDPALTGKGTDQLGSGFYLSNDPEEASGYAGKFHAHTGQENPSPGVIPAHVAIRNPIKIGKKGMSLNDARINLSHDQVKQIMEYVPDLRHPERSPLYNHVDTSRGVTPHMINDIAKLYTGNALHALENDLFYDNPTAYRTALNKVLGYDGVVKDFGNGRKHYVAWFPNQIKSAIGNRGTYDPNDPDITKAKGGQVSQDAMQLALLNKGKGKSVLKELEAYLKQREGDYGVKRLQRAADEIPNLESMYTLQALKEAFGGDNAKALMTMNPADFERFAVRLFSDPDTREEEMEERIERGHGLPPMSHHDYIEHLAKIKGGFADVPFLEVNKRPEYLPNISGHEGRHRSRAMAVKGAQKSLVRLLPSPSMRESMPRRYREDFIEAMKKQLGEKRLVTGEGRSLLPADLEAPEHKNIERRNMLGGRPQLPEIYKDGGKVTHAHHLEIEERPL